MLYKDEIFILYIYTMKCSEYKNIMLLLEVYYNEIFVSSDTPFSL